MSISQFHNKDSALDPLIYALGDAARRDHGYKVFRMATVMSVDIPTTYKITVRFDGESVDSGKLYNVANSYTAIAGQRCLMAQVGSTWIALGQVSARPIWYAFPGMNGAAIYGVGWGQCLYTVDNGWVECTGLLKNNSGSAWGVDAVVGQFSNAAHQPWESQICVLSGNDAFVTVTIQGRAAGGGGTTPGNIVIRAGSIPNQGWISLIGLRWPIYGN